MSVQTYDPVNSGECVLNYRLLVGEAYKAPLLNAAQQAAILNSVTGFNDQVLDEDRFVSEQCQKNMNFADTPAVIGACEGRIIDFHEALRIDINYGIGK